MYRALSRTLVFIGGFSLVSANAQNLTVQLGTPPPSPTPLVNHGDAWRYHKGTNAPAVGWQTTSEAALGLQWPTGNGGFGYSADTAGETNNCLTILTDMQNNYRTLYMRRTFQITNSIATNAHIRFTIDYDDGFVAYLDGVEVQRANVGGTVGVEPSNTTLAPVTHESSLGSAGNAPAVYDLGAVGSRLAIGTHVFAIIGVNGTTVGSSDLIMVPDLAVVGVATNGAVANNGLYALVNTNSVLLTGTNTVAGSTRVTINGNDTLYNAAQGTWTNTQPLVPGLNRLFIAALDASGNLLSNITQDIIYETSRIDAGGTLASSLLASNRGTVLYITNTLFVPTNMTLDIANGAVVLVSPNQAIYTRAGGHIDVHGTFDDRVFFNINGASNALWGPLSGTGTNATISVQFADITHAQVNATTNAYGLVQDCDLHDFDPGAGAGTLGRPIMNCNFASLFEARRVHVWNYYECLVRNGIIHVEQCLFERMSGDALDFDSAQPGSFTRNCTYRHGDLGNVDAVDIGPGDLPGSTDTRIENSIMWDFPFDKGVSVGDGGSSHGIIVSNCLIYGCLSGVMAKDLCDVSVRNCTIVENASGFTNYNKVNPASPTGAGITTNSYNNIVWNNISTIGMANDGQLFADHNDLGNTNWPGVGNFDIDPMFVDAARRNYRLRAGSPCLGAGRGGADLGVTYPLGGIPLPPLKLSVVTYGTSAPFLTWVDDSQNEDGVVVQRSTNAVDWQVIATLPADAVTYTDNTALALKYYYRVQHTNYIATSPFSNIASGGSALIIVTGGNVGGAITADTCWADNGVFTVTSSVTVQSGVTLYIKPGAQVRFNGGLTMTVNGQLSAIGDPANRIRFTKSAANNWGSIDFLNAPVESRIEYADFDSCAGTTIGGHASQIHVNGASKVFFNWLNFANVPAQEYISFDGSSFIVQNSTFPTYPWAMSAPEMLHGVNGINAGGYGIFRSNYFGHTFGFNDTIDFTGGQRPGPILQFIGNVFDGAGDDHLDLDSTDAWIEGNIFMHVHRDPNRTDQADDTGSAISGGVDNAGQFSEWTVINNLFYDVDHVFLNKGGGNPGAGRVVFMNNTVVHVNQESGAGPSTNIAAFIFTDDQVAYPNATYGAGAYVANNIIWDCAKLADNFNTNNHTIIFENNIVSGPWAGLGSNNVVTDPLLNLQLITTVTNATAAQVKAAFTPKTNSPALGAGFGAKYDKGGIQPLGIMVYGEPTNSVSSNATLYVGPVQAWRYGSAVPPFNSGYTFYKWKLDNGAWSAELSTTNSSTIALSNLSSGPHTVYVVGKNDAGYYQDDPFVYPTNISLIAAHATASRTWTVVGGTGLTDTDGDGIPDDWEMANGLNKNDPNDAALDPDGDGMTNLQEYLAGTDPHSAASRLWLQITPPAANAVALQFTAISNKSYTVQYRTSVSTGAWLRVQDIATGAVNRALAVTNVLSDPARFYRVVTPQAP